MSFIAVPFTTYNNISKPASPVTHKKSPLWLPQGLIENNPVLYLLKTTKKCNPCAIFVEGLFYCCQADLLVKTLIIFETMISRLILMYSGEKKHINLEGETTYKANIIFKKKYPQHVFPNISKVSQHLKCHFSWHSLCCNGKCILEKTAVKGYTDAGLLPQLLYAAERGNWKRIGTSLKNFTKSRDVSVVGRTVWQYDWEELHLKSSHVARYR